MKKIVFLLSLVLGLLFTTAVFAEKVSQDTVKTAKDSTVVYVVSDDVYDYPIKPGSPEWKELGSYQARVEACQIPDSTLEKISTEGLIETCLNYPHFFNFIAFDSYQGGVYSIIRRFNGLQELLKREDAGIKLLERYKKMDPEYNTSSVGKTKFTFVNEFIFAELLLAQDVILSNLKENGRYALLKECIKKAQDKNLYINIHGPYTRQFISLIMARILLKEKFKPFVQRVSNNKGLELFIKNANFETVHDFKYSKQEIISEIFFYTEQFISERK
jgi:hypothetical protein